MELNVAIEKFKNTMKQLRAYNHATSLLYYDSVTGAPAGCQKGVGDTMQFFSEVAYKLTVNEEAFLVLDTLMEHLNELDPILKREVEEANKSVRDMRKIPMDEYLEADRAFNDAQFAWHKAKVSNDYASFEPHLAKLVDITKRFSGYTDPDKDMYNAQLDKYEKGLDKATLDTYFGLLKEKLIPLIKRIGEAEQIDDSFLYRSYPIEKQREFSDYLMQVMGIDRTHCAISETEHPFTLNFSKYDVRITTHYHENMLASSMYSVIHEGGHALYELNTGDDLYGTLLANGASMGMHECQSRFYENIIGRSREFIELIFPKMQEIFSEQLSDVTSEQMYRAVNKCQPSLIRTEADELTYSLHILIRYEIEKMLFDGSVTTKELPDLWNRLYREYLGVDVPNDTNGVLQDSHWSGGSFGYFPSYSIGSAYAAQIMHHMKKTINILEVIKDGEIHLITQYLAERIYKYGKLLTPNELIMKCCGEPFDPRYYIDYLTDKFTALYGL
ncbi:MAG: carboxypeptidase M32 [Clostridia bacterium]|nr:carboxypeptidase M32 [Clostridia bacterium]